MAAQVKGKSLMALRSFDKPVLALLCLVGSASCGAPEPESYAQSLSDADSASVASSNEALHSYPVTADLQQEISQVLWGCYAVGADLVGRGDVEASKKVLRKCYSNDMVFESVLPPAYAGLAFTTTGGADPWVDVSNQFYRSMHFSRVQHLITNIVINRTGPNTATVDSGAIAVHVYPDEHVFSTTVKFVDEFRRTNGTWWITHRTMTVLSVFQAAAWAP